jgi:opacity protein-like surface antigen
MRVILRLAAIAWVVATAPAAWAQKGIEVTPFAGEQINHGLDVSTDLYNRLDVKNGLNYGVVAGYALNSWGSVEFMWNHNQADTFGQPIAGGANVKVFTLKTNQYLGDFLFQFKSPESRLRPFFLVGAGANHLAPDRSDVNSTTRFTWVLGGGVKYTFSKHLGARLQARWTPTYINTTTAGVWCDPYWGGCWTKGDSVFLNEFDFTGGLTFRF